jgi:tetratricopeptide (TPR) repeat protein
MENKPTGQQIIERLLRDPENWELRLSAAATLSAEGRAGEAVTILDSAPNPPDCEPELLQCAEIYAQTQPPKAVQLLHGWLQRYPHSAVVHLAMADTALRLGDHTGAQAYYQRAIELQPEYRDPDLETRYGLRAPQAPIQAPVATQPPAPQPAAQSLPETPAPKSEAKTPALGPWITAATAAGVFLLGWLLVALTLRAMIGR